LRNHGAFPATVPIHGAENFLNVWNQYLNPVFPADFRESKNRAIRAKIAPQYIGLIHAYRDGFSVLRGRWGELGAVDTEQRIKPETRQC
jgi:hypothetical protein